MTPRNSPLRSGADFEIVSEELTPEDVHRATFGDVSRGGLVTEAAKGLRRYMDGRSTGDFAVRALEAEQAGDQAAFDRLMTERATRHASMAPDAPRVAGATDVRGLRDAVDWAGSTLGEGLPSLGPSIAGAAIGRRLLGGTLGKAPAAAIGAAYPAYHDIRGGEVDAQYSDPALAATSADDRARTASKTAGLGAALEVLLPTRLVGGLGRGTRVGRALTGDALTEAVTEGGQSAISQIGNMGLDPGREFSYKELVDSALAGGLVGGAAGARTTTMQNAVSAIDGLRARAADSLRRDPQPGADAAPPGTPLLPAPDDGSGGDVGGLSDGIRDRAQKTKDYVSDTIDRMGEAAKAAQTPGEFLRQIFGSNTEDAAAADLRHDTEDPSVLNSPDPAAAMEQRDAQRQERAASFATELLNDPATPEAVKERVLSFGGDFSSPEAQAFVARNLISQRAGEKLVNAVGDLYDLSKNLGGKAAEAGTDLAGKARDMLDKSMEAARDRIVKKNLQGINEADVAPLVRLLAHRLGPTKAAEAPRLARQLVAAANRLSPDARITEESERRLRNLSKVVDDEVLNLVTELSGSDALRNTIAKIRSIPSAASDVRQSGGQSFLESMLKQPLEPAVLSQLSEFVDTLGLQLGSMSSERKNQVLAGLAAAFGSKREAQTVVEYYGNIRREALRKDAERGDYGPDADVEGDTAEDSSYQLESTDAVEDPNYEGDDTAASKAEWGALTESDGPKTQYGFRESKSKRPFRKFVGEELSSGRTRREAVRAVVDSRGRENMNYGFVDYADYLADNNITPEQGVEERKRDIERLLKGHRARKGEDRSSSINALEGELELLERAVADHGAKGALNRLYEVTSRAERGDEDLSASDDDLRAMKTKVRPNTRGMTKYQRKVATEKHNRTLLNFVDADGKYLTLSAPSMVATLGSKRGKMGRVVEGSEQKDSDTLKDAIASVIARGYTLVSDLNEVALTPDGPAVFAGRTEERRSLVMNQGGKRIATARVAAERLLKRLEAAIDRAGDPADVGYNSLLEEKTYRVLREIEQNAKADVDNRTEARRVKEEALEQWREKEMPDKGALWASYVDKRTAFDIATDLTQISTDAKYSATSLMRDARNAGENLERSGSTVEDRSGEVARGQENRRLERQRADLIAELIDAIIADDLLLQTRIRARLEQNAKALAELQKQGVKERAQSGAGRLLEEKAPKTRVPDTPPASKPRTSSLRTDAILAANPELLTVLDGYGEPKDAKWSESAIRERVFNAYRKLPTTALKTRLESLRKQYREAMASKNRGAQQEATTIKYIGELINSVIASRGAKKDRPGPGPIRKHSFVGAKADPRGAEVAEKLLGIGAPADVVWRDLGWFRGPDGKLRKEIRSPVLRRRVREFATAVANGSRDAVTVRDLLAGIDAFKPYLDKLGDLQVDPNDGMVELMGAVGAYNGEDGFSSRGIGISQINAELAVRMDAVPGGKGAALLREIVESMIPPELADMGLNFTDPMDIIAELEARHPMPDVNERVAELLAGTILHELQHAFQHVEGFENGGNATTAVIAKYGDVDEYLAAVRDGDEGTVESITEQAFSQLRAEVGPDGDIEAAAHELYESIVGEVEANDVAARMKLDDAEAREVAPALADAKREFVKSVLLAEALSAVRGLHSATSGMGAKKGRPGKPDTQKIIDEILRLRGKDVKVRIDKLVKDLGGSGQYTYDRATGERLIEVAINAASQLGTARHEAMHDLFRFLSKDPATRSIAKDLRDAASAPHVIRQLRDLLKDHKEALEQLSDPEERAAYAYQFWAEGLLRIGPRGTGVFHTIRKFLRDLFGVATAGQRGEDLMRAFHDGKFADPSTVQEVLQDLNDRSGDRLRNKMERATPALVKATRAVFTPATDRLRSFENDSLNELADKFFSDTGGRSGFIQNKYQQEGVWRNRLAALLDGTTATERRAAIDQLQAMAPKSPLAKALAKYNKDIYEYMRDAGVMSWDSSEEAFVPLREVQNYFTRSWDADAIAGNRAEFEALLRKEGEVSATDAAAIADNLIRGTEARPGPKEDAFDLGYMPYAPHTAERILTFINPSNAQAFAKFQHKDLADTMTTYVRSAVHRAEYAREFGNNGERIVALVEASGIRGKEALAEISNSVQALEGSLDPGKWSPETKHFMAGIQTLQNVVILPLALASQMIDPIVLAARSGDIRDAGRAYVTALQRLKNTVTKSSDGVVGEDLANILGIVSEDSTLQAMAMAYGTTRMSKRMEAVNRVFFRYNGMEGWNNSMRIAATAAGERYLLANKRNTAALAELGLTSKDVKADKNGRLDVSSPKVQQAMFRFVDQAVLRPSPAQRPVWMSDPRFLLVAHLKQFTFAMHNVVLKRANRELSAGNPKPWAALMLAMPVMLAADIAKFALTGSAPSTWGYKDYLVHAVERSGLLGLGDFGVQAMSGVGRGKMPGEELLGPSFEHLMEVLRWIGGDPRTGFGDVIDRTVPGARFI